LSPEDGTAGFSETSVSSRCDILYQVYFSSSITVFGAIKPPNDMKLLIKVLLYWQNMKYKFCTSQYVSFALQNCLLIRYTCLLLRVAARPLLFVSLGVRGKPRMYCTLLAYCTARFGRSDFGHQMPPRLPARSAL
jgi:hypothetical protein